MSTRTRSWLGWLVALALVAGLGVSLAAPAVGGPSFLTLAKAKKTFLTKKKAKRTFVTKQQASSYLTAGGADQRYLRRAGETRVPITLASWKLADSTDDASANVRATDVVIQKNNTSAQDVDYFAQVATPTQIGGVPLKAVGIELCYDITESGFTEPVIDRIALQRVVRSSPAPTGLTVLAADETGRVDDACTTVRFAAVPLLPTDLVGVGLRVDFDDPNTQLRLGAGSLILSS